MNIEELWTSYNYIIIPLAILIVIYFANLSYSIAKVRYEIEDTKKKMAELSEKQTALLERIAKALEQEPEPYIIEKDEDKS